MAQSQGIAAYIDNELILYPFIASIAFLTFICILGMCLRSTVIRFTPDESLVRKLLLAYLSTLEYCLGVYELTIVFDYFGMFVFTIFYLCLTIWWSFTWMNGATCSAGPIEEAVVSEMSIRDSALLIGTELLAAVLSWYHIRLWWGLEVTIPYLGKSEDSCRDDLKVGAFKGAFVEGLGVLGCSLAYKFLVLGKYKIMALPYAFIQTYIMRTTYDYTGGYFNSIAATALKLRCGTDTLLTHFIVYWVGPIIATLISLQLYFPPCEEEEEEESSETKAD